MWRSGTLAIVAAASAAVLLAGQGVGQPRKIEPEQAAGNVDEYIRGVLERQNIPGLSLVVIKDGLVVKAEGYGRANVELDVPATADTVYQSGSTGKQFTATAVMLLVEDGKVRLDDPIGRYLRDAPEAWAKITVRHMLTHTAGLANDLPIAEYRNDYTEDELLKRIMAIPLEFAPGEKWAYSNLGYKVLGILVSKVSGKFYGDVLAERVFAPLGMTTTRIISEADVVPNRAAGYRLENGVLKNQQWVAPTMNTTGDGSLYLTVHDLAKWDAALRDARVLKQASLDQMWTPVTLNNGDKFPYGFGFALRELKGRRNIGHSGAWQGFTSDFARFVDDGVTVGVLVNRAGVDVARIAGRVAGYYDDDLKPVEHRVVLLPPDALDELVGEYDFGPQIKLVLTREDNRLWAKIGDDAPLEFKTESAVRLFNDDVGVVLVFSVDAAGKVTQFTVGEGGRVVPKLR